MPISYTYDPTTGKWGKTETSSGGSGSSQQPTSGGQQTGGQQTSGSGSGGDNLRVTTGDNESATGKAEQEANDIEINILVGQLSFIATEDTIKIRAGDTVTLRGIGQYLSGKYYVKEMHRQISERGYSHNATLIKTDFGESLKPTVKKASSNSGSVPVATTTKKEVTVQNKPQANLQGNVPKQTVKVQKGDSWSSLAVKAKILNAIPVGAVSGAVGAVKGVAVNFAKAVATSAVSGAIKAVNAKDAISTVNTTIAAKPVTVSKPKVGASVTVSNIAARVATKNVLLKK